jgi:ABC-type branched-subunit amino acid transport system permease subunit
MGLAELRLALGVTEPELMEAVKVARISDDLTYNHQKENIAWLATALYLAGATAVVSGTFWTKWPGLHQAALATGVLVAAMLAITFTWWQFEQRRFAMAMVAACTDLAARWIHAAPAESTLKPECLNGRDWPSALVERFREVRSEVPSLPRTLTILAIVLWTAAAIARVVENCR